MTIKVRSYELAAWKCKSQFLAQTKWDFIYFWNCSRFQAYSLTWKLSLGLDLAGDRKGGIIGLFLKFEELLTDFIFDKLKRMNLRTPQNSLKPSNTSFCNESSFAKSRVLYLQHVQNPADLEQLYNYFEGLVWCLTASTRRSMVHLLSTMNSWIGKEI